MKTEDWVKMDDKHPPGSGCVSDPYLLVTDGNFIGTGQFWGDIWECVEWLEMDMPKPFSEERYYYNGHGFMKKDPVEITHWRYLPELPI